MSGPVLRLLVAGMKICFLLPIRDHCGRIKTNGMELGVMMDRKTEDPAKTVTNKPGRLQL